MEKKKPKKFKPCKQFRFLPGSVVTAINFDDLYIYNLHRLRVYNAKPLVDSKPFKLNPYKVMPYVKLRNAFHVASIINTENKQLMEKLNYIHRNGGVVDSFNPNAFKVNNIHWLLHENFMKAIVQYNKAIYKIIMNAQPKIKKKEFDDFFKVHEKKFKQLCKFPVCVGMKPNYDLILSRKPSISSGLNLKKDIVRPQCFLEFKVKDGKYLGKIIIELYEDCVPTTCQNFMEICKGKNGLTYKGCLLHRIVKGKYIETGDITRNNGRGGVSIFGNTFHEEKHILKHTRAGTVSMKRISLADNNSQFIITLNEMETFDKMHAVFGKVIKGNNVLFYIEDYGRRIGKPYAEVIISNCGVIEREVQQPETTEEN